MLQVTQPSAPAQARFYDHALGTAYATAYALALRTQDAAQCGLRRMTRRVQLRSRRGEGNAIWTMLVVGLIAVVAAVALFPIGQRMIQMGQDAASRLQQPPW